MGLVTGKCLMAVGSSDYGHYRCNYGHHRYVEMWGLCGESTDSAWSDGDRRPPVLRHSPVVQQSDKTNAGVHPPGLAS